MEKKDDRELLEVLDELIERLPIRLVGFPLKVMSLVEQLFGYEKIMFFPVQSRYSSSLGKTKSDVYRNFVTLNIQLEAIEAYRKHIRYIDIFDPKTLPDQLKKETVVFTSDIMTREAYEETEHYKAMHKLGVEQQACISLIGKNEKLLAKMVIFRNIKEKAFDEYDRMIMKRIGRIISNQFFILLNSSDEVMLERGFDLILKSSAAGAIIVNHRLTVIQANRKAFELTEAFEKEFKSEHDYFLRNNKQLNKRFLQIQEMIDWVGLELISSGSKNFSSVSKKFDFSSSSFSFIDSNGEVETNHLILLLCQDREIDEASVKLYDRLTPREQSIVRQILSGMSNEEMAEHNKISIYTIRTHISNIYQKFGVNSRHALMLKFKDR